VVAGRQVGDEWRHRIGGEVENDDARAVVLPAGVGRLIRVGSEQPAAREAVLEGDVDRRACRLQTAGLRCPAAGRFEQRAGYLVAEPVEHQNVGGKRVCRIENAARPQPCSLHLLGMPWPDSST